MSINSHQQGAAPHLSKERIDQKEDSNERKNQGQSANLSFGRGPAQLEVMEQPHQ
jgi:hypothetical protein